MLTFGVVVLGVTDRRRGEEFWSAALGYEVREHPFGGWARVLAPRDGTGPVIALQMSQEPADDHPRLHFDLHVTVWPSRRRRRLAWYRSAPAGLTGIAIRTTRTSSCWPIRRQPVLHR
jgi:hypothetical protein